MGWMINPLRVQEGKLRPEILRLASAWHAAQSTHPGFLSFVNYDSLAYNISANGTPLIATVPRAGTIVSWQQAVKVNTTNNGSNYWTIKLIRRLADGTTNVTLGLVDSYYMTAGTWYRWDLTIGASTLATDLFVYVNVTKTGSPGNIDLAGPGVFFK
jgi:hypothetical protein